MSDTESDNDSQPGGSHGEDRQFTSQAEKRAYLNALERKRRDHMKDSFFALKDCIPSLQGENGASRAQILKETAEYIDFMKKKTSAHQKDIDELKRQNEILERQIRALEK